MITEGYLVRHYQGAAGARDAALLDVAQDHLLMHLHSVGLFDQELVFKGGTALRKFRAGNLGRFSTDLDFSVPDTVRRRYQFLRDMTDDERRWAQCNARHDREVTQALESLGVTYGISE